MSAVAQLPVAEGPGMRDRIFDAAIDLFAEKGFHGASVRELAQAVGVETASLYYHFPSKQELLREMFDRFMGDILQMLRDASAGPGTPSQRLAEVVRQHVLLHLARAKEACISRSELRALTQENRRQTQAHRDRYERMLRALLEDGVREGEFAIADIPVTSTAILMMCSGASDWYDPGGRLSSEAVAERYVDLVARMVMRAPAPVARATASPPSAGRPRSRSPAAVRDKDNTSGGGAKSHGHTG